MSPSIAFQATPPDVAARQQRLRRLSGRMASLCRASQILLLLGMVAYWFATPAATLLLDAHLLATPATAVGVGTRLAGLAISMLPLAALIWGLGQARRCLKVFESGHFLTRTAVSSLRGFAGGLLLSSVLRPFAAAGASMVLSWAGPPGTKTLALSVGSDTLMIVLLAGTMLVIASILVEAIAVAEENAQFV